MSVEKFFNSNFYVGKENWVKENRRQDENENSELPDEKKQKLEKEFKEKLNKIKTYLKKYLLLDNVNFLFGAGSSIHLGAETIRTIPTQVIEAIEENKQMEVYKVLFGKYEAKLINNLKDNSKSKALENVRNKLSEDVQGKLSNDKLPIEKDEFYLEDAIKLLDKSEVEELYKVSIQLSLEDFLNYLVAIRYLLKQSDGLITDKNITSESVNNLIIIIKKAMFIMCDIDNISLDKNKFFEEGKNKSIKEKMQKEGDYTYHKSFLTSILQRPLNLRRANLFTINYDLAFEYSFDELGIQYIDGFVGFHQRNFRPEVFNYDYFYPGDTTEGKVRRIERVIKYYKLHGSLTWLNGKKGVNNPYELYEKPIELVRQEISSEEKSSLEINIGDVMIYPTSTKKEFTLNFPYSELFRKLAERLQQPETVLFSIGYSFYDEHVNDIIYQALANPSFTLIIVDFNGSKYGEIKRLKELEDPRIIILEGEFLGDFKIFAKEVLPNIDEYDTRAQVAKKLDKLFSDNNNGSDNV